MIAAAGNPGYDLDHLTSPSTPEAEMTLKFRFIGLDCTACARLVEKRLDKKKGVKKVGVSLMTDSVIVKIDPAQISEREVERAIAQIGYKTVRVDSSFR